MREWCKCGIELVNGKCLEKERFEKDSKEKWYDCGENKHDNIFCRLNNGNWWEEI